MACLTNTGYEARLHQAKMNRDRAVRKREDDVQAVHQLYNTSLIFAPTRTSSGASRRTFKVGSRRGHRIGLILLSHKRAAQRGSGTLTVLSQLFPSNNNSVLPSAPATTFFPATSAPTQHHLEQVTIIISNDRLCGSGCRRCSFGIIRAAKSCWTIVLHLARSHVSAVDAGTDARLYDQCWCELEAYVCAQQKRDEVARASQTHDNV
jgi:hypothetical protein